MGAFRNDVIILGGGGLEKMTQDDGGRGYWAKDDVTFSILFWGKISNNFIKKVGFIIRKLS